MIDLSTANWRKSARSAANGGCVEVANLGKHVAVRDSKNPTAPALVFDGAAWDEFLAGLQTGSVEVSFLDDGLVAMRDSKSPDGSVLLYTAFEWECFVDGVENGEFTRA